MLSTDYLYKFSLNLIRKNQSAGLSATDFQYHWNDAQSSYMDDLLGRFQARNNGKEGVNTGLIQNETILQKLSPFIKPITLTISNGTADKPSDFIFRLAMRIGNYDVYKITYDQISNIQTSVIDPPSASSNTYYFVEYEDYYLFLPSSVTSASFDYVSVPSNIIWAYTWDESGRQVYNSGNSVQPLWDSNSCREITKRMLVNIGVSFKDADFSNFGQKVQLTGE